MKYLATILTVFGGLLISAQATIILESTAFTVENSLDTVTLANFSMVDHANRTLVVTVGGERSDAIASLTYGGNAMTPSAISDAGQTHASVWYYDVPATGGTVNDDIVLTWTGANNGFYLGAFSLYNVQAGGPIASDSGNNDTASPITLNYGTASAGDFIIESAGGQAGTTDSGITAPGGISTIYNLRSVPGGGYSVAAGSESVLAAGGASNTWTYDVQAPQRVRAAGALFTSVIPEPSSLVLLGFGLVVVRMLRRSFVTQPSGFPTP